MKKADEKTTGRIHAMGQIRQKGSLAIQRFLVALPVLLKYLAVTKILQVFVLFPGFWSLTQALSLSAGYATINNSNIAPFLLSAQGLVWIVAFIVFVFLTLIMEIGGYMMISAVKLHHKVEPSYMAILRSCFRVLPKVFGPGLIIVFIFNLVILPLAGTELNLSFMAGYVFRTSSHLSSIAILCTTGPTSLFCLLCMLWFSSASSSSTSCFLAGLNHLKRGNSLSP